MRPLSQQKHMIVDSAARPFKPLSISFCCWRLKMRLFRLTALFCAHARARTYKITRISTENVNDPSGHQQRETFTQVDTVDHQDPRTSTQARTRIRRQTFLLFIPRGSWHVDKLSRQPPLHLVFLVHLVLFLNSFVRLTFIPRVTRLLPFSTGASCRLKGIPSL